MLMTENSITASLRVQRHKLRDANDVVAYAVHLNFISARYLLHASGSSAFAADALSKSFKDNMVSLMLDEDWNGDKVKYGFLYADPILFKNVLVKIKKDDGCLLIDVTEEGNPEPLQLKVDVAKFVDDFKKGINLFKPLKNAEELILLVNTELIGKLKGYSAALFSRLPIGAPCRLSLCNSEECPDDDDDNDDDDDDPPIGSENFSAYAYKDCEPLLIGPEERNTKAKDLISELIRTQRPMFRDANDKVVYVVHLNFITAGYLLRASGPPAVVASSLPISITDGVSSLRLDKNWNDVEGGYVLLYSDPIVFKNLQVKFIVMGNGCLMVDVTEEGYPETLHLEIEVAKYVDTNGISYMTPFKNMEELIGDVYTELLEKLKRFEASIFSSLPMCVPMPSSSEECLADDDEDLVDASLPPRGLKRSRDGHDIFSPYIM